MHQRDRRTPFWGIPSHEKGYLLDVDRSTFLGSSEGRFNTDYTMISSDLTHEFQNVWTGKIKANHYNHISHEKDLFTLDRAYDLNDETYVDLFGREQDLVVGASYIRSRLNIDERWSRDAFPVSLENPSANILLPTRTSGAILQTRHYAQYGIYGQLNYKLTDHLATQIAGQVNWAEQTSDIKTRFKPDYRENAFFTPQFGLAYYLTPSTTLYASYSEFHQPQFQRDAQRNPLPSLTGTQYEGGVKTELFEGALFGAASVFDITRKYQAHQVGRPIDRIFISDGVTKSQGFEIELSGEINEAWKVFAGYTYADNRVTKSTDADRLGKTASNSPRNKFNLWVNHEFQQEALEGLKIGAGFSAVTSFVDYNNPLEAPGYATADAAISYQVNPNLDVLLKISNIFDKTYYERLGSSGKNHFMERRET